jgi:hypothetical protein
MATLPGLGFLRALVVTQASTASTYIAPGGAAVGIGLSYAMLRGWGFKGRPVTIAVAVTGIWNQFAMLGFPVIALALVRDRTGHLAAGPSRSTSTSRPGRYTAGRRQRA